MRALLGCAAICTALLTACGTPADDESVDAISVPSGPAVPVGVATFGQPCSTTAGCAEGLSCVFTSSGASQGYCTQGCAVLADLCEGAPGRSRPICVLERESALLCGFVCKIDHGDHVHNYTCPEGLTCSTTPSEGTEVYLCVP